MRLDARGGKKQTAISKVRWVGRRAPQMQTSLLCYLFLRRTLFRIIFAPFVVCYSMRCQQALQLGVSCSCCDVRKDFVAADGRGRKRTVLCFRRLSTRRSTRPSFPLSPSTEDLSKGASIRARTPALARVSCHSSGRVFGAAETACPPGRRRGWRGGGRQPP